MKTEILQNKKITETQKKKKIAIVKISSRSFTKQTKTSNYVENLKGEVTIYKYVRVDYPFQSNIIPNFPSQYPPIGFATTTQSPIPFLFTSR